MTKSLAIIQNSLASPLDFFFFLPILKWNPTLLDALGTFSSFSWVLTSLFLCSLAKAIASQFFHTHILSAPAQKKSRAALDEKDNQVHRDKEEEEEEKAWPRKSREFKDRHSSLLENKVWGGQSPRPSNRESQHLRPKDGSAWNNLAP